MSAGSGAVTGNNLWSLNRSKRLFVYYNMHADSDARYVYLGSSKARALFDYVAQATNQLSLQKGKTYDLSHYGGPGGWSKGTDEFGRSGFFPSDYVELVKSSPVLPPSAPLSTSTGNLRARVLYNFTGSSANEMNLIAGQIIEVVRRGPAGGWSKGLTGAFPADFVEYLPAVAPSGSNAGTPSSGGLRTDSLLDLSFGTTSSSSTAATKVADLLSGTSSASAPGTIGLTASNTTGTRLAFS